MRRFVLAALLLPLALPAQAGMGVVVQKWKPPPCEGDACKGDDPRSGLPCQGLLCTFSSAKSLQQPVTATQAEAQKAEAQKIMAEPKPEPKPAASTRKKRARHAKAPATAKPPSGQAVETSSR